MVDHRHTFPKILKIDELFLNSIASTALSLLRYVLVICLFCANKKL